MLIQVLFGVHLAHAGHLTLVGWRLLLFDHCQVVLAGQLLDLLQSLLSALLVLPEIPAGQFSVIKLWILCLLCFCLQCIDQGCDMGGMLVVRACLLLFSCFWMSAGLF